MPLPQRQPPGAILIVEDHELTITMLTELLTKAFPAQRIHVARGAQEARRKVAEVTPIVIVMDIGLPDGNGLDLTREITDRAHDVHVVVHSTHDSQVFQDESLKAGARAFVSKNSVGDLVPVLGRFIACPA
jgi:two-component system invasion response regulator UvrY